MEQRCRQASSIRLLTRLYNQAGLRISRQESMACTSPHRRQAGQRTISALPGLSRCLIAIRRQKLDDLTGYLSLMAMDPMLLWIVSTIVIRIRILLAILPPRSTHTLQPLDVVLFKPLSSAYSAELTTHLQESQGLLPIKKGDFFPLFWKAWMSSFKEETILKSFEATGISPFNPQA